MHGLGRMGGFCVSYTNLAVFYLCIISVLVQPGDGWMDDIQDWIRIIYLSHDKRAAMQDFTSPNARLMHVYYTEHGSCWWILFGCESSGRVRDNFGQSLISSLSGFPGSNNIYWAIGLRDTYYSSVGIQFLMFDWNGIYTRYRAARCLCHLSAISMDASRVGAKIGECFLTQYTVWEHLHLFTQSQFYQFCILIICWLQSFQIDIFL